MSSSRVARFRYGAMAYRLFLFRIVMEPKAWEILLAVTIFAFVPVVLCLIYGLLSRRKNMGGKNEVRLPGPANLRIHENGSIHVHDDKEKIKFVMQGKEFKKEYANVKKALQGHVLSNVFAHSITDKAGVELIGEVNGGVVEWKLKAPELEGFTELDTFVASL